VQKTVMDAWSDRRDDRDVVIKTNTGGGRTIVGLLMLQYCLHEKKGPRKKTQLTTQNPIFERHRTDRATQQGLSNFRTAVQSARSSRIAVRVSPDQAGRRVAAAVAA
jgi:hypothetical protein